MPESFRTPFNTGELDTLQALSAKANRYLQRDGLAPFYCAADGGDAHQPDGWLFLAWPATNPPSAQMALYIFEELAHAAHQFLGARMVMTGDEETSDGDH